MFLDSLFNSNLEILANNPSVKELLKSYGPTTDIGGGIKELDSPPCYQLYLLGNGHVPKLHRFTESVVLIEPDLHAVRQFFTKNDLKKWLGDKEFFLVMSTEEKDLQEFFYSYYRQPMRMAKSELNQLFVDGKYKPIEQDIINNIYAGRVKAQISFRSPYQDVVDGLANLMVNCKKPFYHYNNFNNVAKGKKALICAAGPTLNKDIDTILKHQDKKDFVVITVNTSMSYLDGQGVKVDFCTALDRKKGLLTFVPNDLKNDTILVDLAWINDKLLDKFKGNIVHLPYSLNIMLKALEIGGNWPEITFSVQTALTWAVFLGCREICFAGLDLGRTVKQEDYCGGFDIKKSLEEHPAKKNYVYVKNKRGVTLRTLPQFLEQAHSLGQLGLSSKGNVKLYNCSFGLEIDNFEDVELEDWFRNVPDGKREDFHKYKGKPVISSFNPEEYKTWLRETSSKLTKIIKVKDPGKQDKLYRKLFKNDYYLNDVVHCLLAWVYIKYMQAMYKSRLFNLSDFKLRPAVMEFLESIKKLCDDTLQAIEAKENGTEELKDFGQKS